MNQQFNLQGKKGLIIGIANDQSIAYGCARIMHAQGAELAVTYLNAKAEPHVRPLAEGLGCPIIMPCDVQVPGELEAVFAAIEARWGKLDFVVHSVASAKKEEIHRRLVDCTAEGFAIAMDVTCHSFIRAARLSEPLMTDGGCLVAMSYFGAEKVVPNYNIMGPVKAALEGATRYLAHELGPRDIRVHCVSPGPVMTRAASGLKDFDQLAATAEARSPLRRLITQEECGQLTAFLVGDGARTMTGSVIHADAGYNIMG